VAFDESLLAVLGEDSLVRSVLLVEMVCNQDEMRLCSSKGVDGCLVMDEGVDDNPEAGLDNRAFTASRPLP